ncbi:hypothetical protein [Tahibacter sp.]|uniref:hypothetical protein n=1 Tax=Tahibacter sp. TaxID=2056211 RepID=UPI0028C4C94A|nr:hypothetical protein [Tahibacter sp.]
MPLTTGMTAATAGARLLGAMAFFAGARFWTGAFRDGFLAEVAARVPLRWAAARASGMPANPRLKARTANTDRIDSRVMRPCRNRE